MKVFPPLAAKITIFTRSTKDDVTPCFKHQYNFDLSKGIRDPLSKFRAVDGRSKPVQEWIQHDPQVQLVLEEIRRIAYDHINIQHSDYLSIGLSDHHGTHISPAVGELASDLLDELRYSVGILHEKFI